MFVHRSEDAGKTRLAKTLAGLDEVRGGLYVGMGGLQRQAGVSYKQYALPAENEQVGSEDVINMQIRREAGVSTCPFCRGHIWIHSM